MASDTRRSGSRPILARLALGSVLVVFVALAIRIAMRLDQPLDLVEQKLAGAERYLYYRVTPETGPRFELDGDESQIRIVSHVVVSPQGAYDPARELEYGVRIEVDLDDGRKWRRDVYTRSRQSKARWVPDHGGMMLDENTFSLERLELTDDRLLVVALPANLRPGTTLRVTLLGEPALGFVRVYTPIPRTNIEQHAHDLVPAERSRLAERIGYLPWDRVTGALDLESLRFTERRLSADGEDGIDYETQTLYTTEFRLRYTNAVERGVLVTAEHGAAVNVVGPAHVDLDVARPTMFEVTSGKLDVRLVGEGRLPAPLAIPLPDRGASTTAGIDIPAGIFTLTVTATAAATVELVAAPNRAVALGGIAGAPLVPDEQLVTAYLSGPDGPPISIAVDGPSDVLGRVLRIDVRTLASVPAPAVASRTLRQWPAAPVPSGSPSVSTATPLATPLVAPLATPLAGSLLLEALDREGHVIVKSSAAIASETTPFETAMLFGKLTASVSEPINIRFVVPPAGREVRIRTDRPALVQISTPVALSPPRDRLEFPYDLAPLTTTIWRYARYAERGWLPVRPRNLDLLAPARIVTLRAQARLESRLIPPAPEVAGLALPPVGRLEHQTVVERVSPEDAAGFVARWTAGHYTAIVPGRPVTLELSRAPSRPSIQYWASGGDDAIVGASMTLAIDGRALETKVFETAQGRFRLPAGLSGPHQLVVETTAPVRLLVDRPPTSGGAELFVVRSIYKISEGRTVTVPVTKHGARAQNVNLVVYTHAAGVDPDASIRIVIDDGEPARLAGVALTKWTLADRTVPLPAADRPATLQFASLARGGVLYPRLLVVALGDDLAAGPHTVKLSVTGASQTWGRLFTLENAPTPPRALQWRGGTDTEETTP
ncbi:MAG: hypothetical protein H6Q90_4873 [Deltaproteobacteria bacterium]|nr:hypothetical protein [Deltaproteobacteria bacterium]